MNIEDFYQQARAWQDQEEEAQRIAARKLEEEAKVEWRKINDAIRAALPIEAMSIHETSVGQFDQFPSIFRGQTVDCQIFPKNRENMKYSPNDVRRRTEGVIRVLVAVPEEEVENAYWEVIDYQVWVDGQLKLFDNPNAAFLAAYKTDNMYSIIN
jgi:hypothetical protein